MANPVVERNATTGAAGTVLSAACFARPRNGVLKPVSRCATAVWNWKLNAGPVRERDQLTLILKGVCTDDRPWLKRIGCLLLAL